MQQHKQKQETTSNTAVSNLILMKNVIRMSISSICKFRNIFHDDLFKKSNSKDFEICYLNCTYKDDNKNEIIMNNESFLLTKWLENSVFVALTDGYLKTFKFHIYTMINGLQKNLETYEFKIQYENQDNNIKLKINDIDLNSKESLKHQSKKFIRSLIEFNSTLDELPEERYLSLMLQYNDLVPDNYEPKYFKSSSDGNEFKINNNAIKVKIGSINSSNLSMNMKFTGLETLNELICIDNDNNSIINDTLSSTSLLENNIVNIYINSDNNSKSLSKIRDYMYVK
jgi:hypothetical protein